MHANILLHKLPAYVSGEKALICKLAIFAGTGKNVIISLSGHCQERSDDAIS